MILSIDTIMRPPYEITNSILKHISSISEKIGEINASYLDKQSPQLRKQNKIKTIHSSLQIEGNTLSEEQVTAIIENKKIIGPQKDVQEVLNALEVYENLQSFRSNSQPSFLKAHKILMHDLIEKPGKYRTKGVGIMQGSKLSHIAPSAEMVPGLMTDLFAYLKTDGELPLIKSCVFHYEMEFIHPFLDGNGRMGRLWQTVILQERYPVFEFLPFETLISETQKDYYKALELSDNSGKSTIFIEYMLTVIEKSLAKLLRFNNRTMTASQRIDYFIGLDKKEFSRKAYMNVFKDISSATASRDLKSAVELNLFIISGAHNKTRYNIAQ